MANEKIISGQRGYFLMTAREKMENLISRRINIECVPDSYVLPPELRPGKQIIPVFKNVPVIDLGSTSRKEIVEKILEACQEYGFFQVINHGVTEEVMQRMLMVIKDFFERPVLEDMASCYSDDPTQSCRLYTSVDYDREKIHCWRDALRVTCHDPIEDCAQSWPLKTPQNREVAVKYAEELRKLSWWILDVIAEGIGFETGYFGTNLSQSHIMSFNHYPACPDPSLTLGLHKHSDFNLITLLQQEEGVVGLQALMNDKWVGIEPVPNAFLVNVGCTLEVLCNGKLKSDVHRVVTTSVSRTAIATAIHPSWDVYIQPDESMVNGQSPACYRGFVYKDLFISFLADTNAGKHPMERYELNHS